MHHDRFFREQVQQKLLYGWFLNKYRTAVCDGLGGHKIGSEALVTRRGELLDIRLFVRSTPNQDASLKPDNSDATPVNKK